MARFPFCFLMIQAVINAEDLRERKSKHQTTTTTIRTEFLFSVSTLTLVTIIQHALRRGVVKGEFGISKHVHFTDTVEYKNC